MENPTPQVVRYILSEIMYSKSSIKCALLSLAPVVFLLLSWGPEMHCEMLRFIARGAGACSRTPGSVSFCRAVFLFQKRTWCFSAFVSVSPSLSDFPTQASSSPHPLPVSPFSPQQLKVHTASASTSQTPTMLCGLPLPQPAASLQAPEVATGLFSDGWGQSPALGPGRGHLEFLVALVT